MGVIPSSTDHFERVDTPHLNPPPQGGRRLDFHNNDRIRDGMVADYFHNS